MKNFTFYKPTKIYFGRGALEHLREALMPYGQNVLLVYGKGSIIRSGLYERVKSILFEAEKNVFELPDVMPNPRTEKVYEGIKICRENACGFILAVGGGSVIDCAKAIAGGTLHDGDFWQEFYISGVSIDQALPLGTVLTIPATGSEMNGGAVITYWKDDLKLGYSHPLLHPQFSILDPELTMTMPKEQIVYGAVDMMSHVFEQYFSYPDDENLSDYLSEAVLNNIRINLDKSLEDPSNYQARSNLMWDATVALNGILALGKDEDWQAHKIEHALSACYDIPHGAGLAIVHPNLLSYMRKEAAHKLARYAENVWGVDPTLKTEETLALDGLTLMRDYFNRIGAPATLTDVGIPANAIGKLADVTPIIRTGYRALEREDVFEILKLSV